MSERFTFDARVRRLTINDHFVWQCVERDGEMHMTCSLFKARIFFSLVLPPPEEVLEDDIVFWAERIQTAIWGIIGQHGVLGVEVVK